MLYGLAMPFLTVKHQKVVSVASTPSPHVILDSGEVINADLIIGADGIKSIVRQSIVEGLDRPVSTGDLAYRAIYPPLSYWKIPTSARWLRPRRCRAGWDLVGILLATVWWVHRTITTGVGDIDSMCRQRGQQQYNLVMLRPDIQSEESWVATAENEEIRETFKGWNKRSVHISFILGLNIQTFYSIQCLKTRGVNRRGYEFQAGSSSSIREMG